MVDGTVMVGRIVMVDGISMVGGIVMVGGINMVGLQEVYIYKKVIQKIQETSLEISLHFAQWLRKVVYGI